MIYFADGSIHELGGFAEQTTNNRMEMQAAIAALEYLLQAEQDTEQPAISLFTDSEYVKNGVTQWIKGWKQKGWKTSTGKPVLNQDLWQTLDDLTQKIRSQGIAPPQWKYVRGHSGNEGNERCDTIARAFSLGKSPALHQRPVSPLLKAEIQPKDSPQTEPDGGEAIQSTDGAVSHSPAIASKPAMVDSTPPPVADGSELPREVRVSQLRNLVETLHMADEIARQGYLITSSELADLMDVNASAVTSRGDNWVWRNWVVSRVRREGNQILWQLERVD